MHSTKIPEISLVFVMFPVFLFNKAFIEMSLPTIKKRIKLSFKKVTR